MTILTEQQLEEIEKMVADKIDCPCGGCLEELIEKNKRHLLRLIASHRELQEKLKIAEEALEYCSRDDIVAIDHEGKDDFVAADFWKKVTAEKALEKIRREK